MHVSRARLWSGGNAFVFSPPSAASSTLTFGLGAVVLLSSLFLGGGTRPGFLSDAILQLIAIPALLIALWQMQERRSNSDATQIHWAYSFCLGLVILALIQLISMPPSIWTALPGHEVIKTNFSRLGQELAWMPISVLPNATWLSLLALLPPLAIFFITIQLGYPERRRLSLLILVMASLSVFVGLAQVAQGPSSALRFFDFTNPTEAVGFFANRNHYSALLYSSMLLVTAWAVNLSQMHAERPQKEGRDTAQIVMLIVCFTVLVMLVAAQLMARSRAGLGLTMGALLGALALAVPDRHVRVGTTHGASLITPRRLIIVETTLALVFSTQFALYRIQARFVADPLADARLPFARNTIEAAWSFMPFGSGLGTFVPVYAMFEKPDGALANRYANHAHNDFLQLWLEAGAIGIVLLGAFLVWLALRAYKIWRYPRGGGQAIDTALARSATLIVAFLLAHSFVDYPLRTGAMACIFAFACALLIEPPKSGDTFEEAEVERGPRQSGRESGQSRRPNQGITQPREQRPSSASDVALNQAPPAMSKSGQRWGEGIQWPDEWRSDARSPRAAGCSQVVNDDDR